MLVQFLFMCTCSSCLAIYIEQVCSKCLLHKACDYRHSIVLLLLPPLSLSLIPSCSLSLSLSFSLFLTLNLSLSSPFFPSHSPSFSFLSWSGEIQSHDFSVSPLSLVLSIHGPYLSTYLSLSLCVGIIVGQLVLSSCTT